MEQNKQFPNEVWFKEWIKKFGRDSQEVENERKLADEESDEIIRKTNVAARIENEESITIRDTKENFPKSGSTGFAYTVGKIGKMFAHTEDIEVRYSKPEDENGNVVPEIIISNLPLIKFNKEQEKLQAQQKK